MHLKRSKIIAVFVSIILVLSNVSVLDNIKYVKASDIPSIEYSTHVQDIGWQKSVKDGELAGTTGKAKRIEAIRIQTNNDNLGVSYSTHVQNVGWTDYVGRGVQSGTVGENKRVEAIAITLTGSEAKNYDIYYRVHVQNIGWLGWAKNGANAGTCGYQYRIEGIEIKTVAKGDAAPGSTNNSFYKKGASTIVTPSEPEKPKDNTEDPTYGTIEDGVYYPDIPSSNHFNIYTMDELDLDELLGDDQVYAVEDGMITTPNDVGKTAKEVFGNKVTKDGMYFNRTLSYGLTLNMRKGMYVDYDSTGYLYNYINLLNSGAIEYDNLSSIAMDNEDDYKYYDKEGRALNVEKISCRFRAMNTELADLSEITEMVNDIYYSEDEEPDWPDWHYNPKLTEEVFLVFYNSKEEKNEIVRYWILYDWILD